ncbi:DUF898 family protein [Loktanella sp. IMCC34160]|nr:DUF898 family protein [Loktanella sp. IMCC34160]
MATGFAGRRGRLFGLAFRTSLLTILTLGIYRFWMKTRLRRWYWSAVRPGGTPLEYTGTPIEKLLGFLMAVVIMAFYIGVVNLILMFVSFAVLADNYAAYLTSFLGVIPLWFYASYRSRRYVLARTRWRGIRFGLEPGAWGYTWRAILHWMVTILSLGLLWPRMTFALEKYKIDRTSFGSVRLHQGGKWTMLYRIALLPILSGLTMVGIGVWILYLDPIGPMVPDPFSDVRQLGPRNPERIWLLVLAGMVGCVGIVRYIVQSKAIMANHKTAGGVGLIAAPRTGRVLWIYSMGYFLTYLCMVLLMIPLLMLLGFYQLGFEPDFGEGPVSAIPEWVLIVAGLILYFSIFLTWSVLRHPLVTLPLWRHYAETLTITGEAELAQIRQRDRDEFSEAEGFAEALDVGAAI